MTMALRVAGRHDEPLERYLPCVSAAMQALAASVARVAATDVPVLICGEIGSGKSTLARQICEDSPRRGAPIILQCATATPEVIAGLAQVSDRCVLLEEIGELAPGAQDSLVCLLAAQPPRNGVRLITTSNRDLGELTERHGMRTDLRYRLDVVRLDIPPLRQRREDIIFLAEHFLAVAGRTFHRDVCALSPDARARLLDHRWPGNVRELRNCVMESVLHCPHVRIRAADVRLRTAAAGADPEAELAAALSRLHAAQPGELHARLQRLLLQWAMNVCGGNRIRAATLLGIGRGSLRAKLRRHGLDSLPPAQPAAR